MSDLVRLILISIPLAIVLKVDELQADLKNKKVIG